MRRAARDLGRGKGPVPGQPMGPGHQRRLRLAGRRRTDQGRRPDRGLGLRAEHVDDAPRSPGRHRTRQSFRWIWTPPRSARTGGPTWVSLVTLRQPPGQRQSSMPGLRRPVTGRRGCVSGSRARSAGGTSRSRTKATVTASTRARCRSRSTTCCPPSAWWRSIQATSWAIRACICRSPTPTASASPRRTSPSGSGWPRR